MSEMSRLREHFRSQGMDDYCVTLYTLVHDVTDRRQYPEVFERETFGVRVAIAVGKRVPGQRRVFETIGRMFDDEETRLNVFADYIIYMPWWACPNYRRI